MGRSSAGIATRICRVCQLAKPATTEFFPRHNRSSLGLQRRCKACLAWSAAELYRLQKPLQLARRRELYGDRDRERERQRALRAPLLRQAQTLRSSVSERCKKRGDSRPSWVSTPVIEAWLQAQGACLCCGVEFYYGPKNGICHPASPSFDRWDSSKGYERENVNLICWRCNRIKCDFSAEDLERVARWLRGDGH